MKSSRSHNSERLQVKDKVAKPKQSLKLSFKDVDRDIEKYLERHGKPDILDLGDAGRFPVVRGYDNAQQAVFDAYLEQKKYRQLVDYLCDFNWEVGSDNPMLKRLTETLRREKHRAQLTRLWRSVIAKQKNNFWILAGARGKAPGLKPASIARAKANALASMRTLHDLLVELGDAPASSKLNEEIALLEREQHRQIATPADPRKMDDELFWSIIEAGRQTNRSTAEHVEALTEQLQAFKAGEIRRFQKILLDKFALAYRWDLWALAYVAQGGCSDDAFEEFRAWLILQGRGLFESALKDMHKILRKVPRGLSTHAAELLFAASTAYEARYGKAMALITAKNKKLAGTPWQENDLPRIYPDIVKHYEI
jgi:hypothetical protein